MGGGDVYLILAGCGLSLYDICLCYKHLQWNVMGLECLGMGMSMSRKDYTQMRKIIYLLTIILGQRPEQRKIGHFPCRHILDILTLSRSNLLLTSRTTSA